MIPTQFQVHGERAGFPGFFQVKSARNFIGALAGRIFSRFNRGISGFSRGLTRMRSPTELSDSGLIGTTFKGFEQRVNIF